MKSLTCVIWLLSASFSHAVMSNGGYQTIPPTAAEVPNWTSGWAATGITGWDYIGNVNGASGVYLGNGWVITAGHVGAHDFILSGITYAAVPNSQKTITDEYGLADLTLFQIATPPSLPPLVIASSTPVPFSDNNPGDSAVMIGYGGGQGKTWGRNTITDVNLLVSIDGLPFESVDFETALGTVTAGSSSITNTAQLVSGDSGGGAFCYDVSSGRWILTGISEAIDEYNDSYLVQLSQYASQINAIVAPPVPAPKPWGLIGFGVLAFIAFELKRMKAERLRINKY